MKKTRKILVCLLAMVFCFTSLGITAFADGPLPLFDPELVGKDDGGNGRPLYSTTVGTSEAGIATISDGSTLATVVAPAPAPAPAKVTLTKAQKAKLNKIKKLSKPTLKSVKKGENLGEVVITVKSKVKNATGYEFYKSTKKSSGFKKVAKVQTLSTTATGLNGKYYYKVRAYLKKPNGKTIYSKYSAVKSLDSTVKVAKATYKATLDASALLQDVMKNIDLASIMGQMDMTSMLSGGLDMSKLDVSQLMGSVSFDINKVDLGKLKGASFAMDKYSYSKNDGAVNNWYIMLRAKDPVNADLLAQATQKIAKDSKNIMTNDFVEMFSKVVGLDKLSAQQIDFSKLTSSKAVDINILSKTLKVNINKTIDALGGIENLAKESGMVDVYTDAEYVSTYKNLKRGDMLFSSSTNGLTCIVIL